MRLMYINGEFTEGFGMSMIDVLNPANEEVVDTIMAGAPDDVNAAVAAAKRAFLKWRHVVANDRAGILHGVAEKIGHYLDELVELVVLEQGKPQIEAEAEVTAMAEVFRYYAELGRHEIGAVIPPGSPGQFNFVIREPYGVVGCVVPWNFPLGSLTRKVAPALAAGNTVVIVPSELTPLSALLMAELCFDDLPQGVVNIVTGYAAEIVEPLVAHPDVPLVAYSGGLEGGQQIARIAGPMIKKMHLELGGKDPLVVARDVEPGVMAQAVAFAGLVNCGQMYTSAERVYVPRRGAEAYVEALVAHVQELTVGDGIEASTDVGPLVSGQRRARFEAQIAQAREAGARVAVGGQRPDEFERGFFYQPTVLLDVDHSMEVMCKETFGPAIPVMLYDSFEQAIELANDTRFGLGASLLTSDPSRAKLFFENVRAGTITINDPLAENMAAPFGGMRASGVGRAMGQFGLDEFREVKHVHWDFSSEIKKYWFPYNG